ncbi:N-6 DNA methylase [Deinococcus sp. YIM 134068]|uniref:Eco57I restriction-modification methylase domain-containing protein n=1 Tax=Deinococcus lichenicola TaxID=3118910 RepID=UPI002F93CBFC
MDADQFNAALDALSRRVKAGFTEDAVEHTLTETRFYEALGYERTGRDIRRKPKGKSGIPDALLLNSDDSIQVVVEVKRPSEDLTDHVDQLARYVRDLRARFGILTNGSGFRLYRRDGQALTDLTSGTAAELRAPDFAPLAKQTLNPLDRAQVEVRVRESQGEGLPLRHADDLPSAQFLYSLGLQQGSPFASLVQATAQLLGDLQGKSEFVGGSYDFWKKVYARELDADHIPRLWRDSGALSDTSGEGLYRFSFALETSYALAARLMLAKVIQDHSRGGAITGGTSLADQLLTELGRYADDRTGTLPSKAYPEAVRDLFDRYARTLFTSVYATDIFDWWRDYAAAAPGPAAAFSDALARLLLALLRFDFSTLEGDLLGELYQQYFDPETRKALGEFYTPPAVVNFILDEVGYGGGRHERLLDPATGSGTFLIGALRRYLSANAGRDPVETLRGLTEDYALVAFDLNPFAVIMAQVNFAALLVPLYARAAEQDPDFVLRRLPVIRTDSLRQENLEGEAFTQGSQKGQSMFGLDFGGTTITAQIELPIRVGKKSGHTVHLTFPQVEEAKRRGVVDNEREWLRALQAVFAAVELRSQAFDRKQALPDLGPNIRSFLARGQASGKRLQGQVEYLTPYAEQVWETLKDLKEKHGDGRFLKTLEDLMLGLILKHYLKYDYVVGNPPYVRIQNLPEDLRRYWENLYVWASGNFDLYIPFVERALLGRQGEEAHGWLRPGGRLAYILPNRFMNAGYAAGLRQNLPRVAHLRSLLNMGAATFQPAHETRASKLFKEALVYPAILSVQKRAGTPATPESSAPFPAVRLVPRTLPLDPADALSQVRDAYADLRAGKAADLGELGDALTVDPPRAGEVEAGRRDFTHAGWFLMPPEERAVFEKLDAVGREVDPDVQTALAHARRTAFNSASTAQHSTAQHSTAQHSTAQHSTAQQQHFKFRRRGCTHAIPQAQNVHLDRQRWLRWHSNKCRQHYGPARDQPQCRRCPPHPPAPWRRRFRHHRA